MHVTAHLAKAKDTLVSFEILPPLKGKTITSIYDHLDPLMEFNPSWINVTYHRSETMFKKKVDDALHKQQNGLPCLDLYQRKHHHRVHPFHHKYQR
jgi:methylenetetrahydrofolate reductase (NADPH)